MSDKKYPFHLDLVTSFQRSDNSVEPCENYALLGAEFIVKVETPTEAPFATLTILCNRRNLLVDSFGTLTSLHAHLLSELVTARSDEDLCNEKCVLSWLHALQSEVRHHFSEMIAASDIVEFEEVSPDFFLASSATPQ